MDDGAPKAISSDLEQALAGRLLRLEGEIALSKNIEKVRRFLRGEGYSWASDLSGAGDRDDSLLAATGSLPEGRQDKLRSIHRFASDLSRYTELQPMLQEALRRYLDILQCDAGSIYLWDENTETLILEAAHGADERERLGLRQKLGEGLAGWVAEVGEPILVTDSRKVHKLQGRVSSRYSNFSCIATPITHGGQLFGIVCLTMPKDNEPFDPEDLRLAQALSQKLASAIRPLSVLSELRRFSERLLGAFKSSSDSEIKKDAQVESLRVLSGNILESVPMAIIAYDRELRVRSSNRVARSLFGIAAPAASEPEPAPLEQGVELDKALWRNRLLSVIEAGRKFRLQRVGYRARQTEGGQARPTEGSLARQAEDGQAGDRKLVLDIHCSPLTDPEGQTVGGILTVQDVTEDLEMEAKLSSAERLALVGKLAAKVAHELNNPLDGILRFLNLAMRQLDKPEQARAYLEDSRIGLLRMSNILKELLVFSRSHREPTTVSSLSQVIQQAVAPYEHRARECRTQIRLRRAAEPAALPDQRAVGGHRQRRQERPRRDGRKRPADDPRRPGRPVRDDHHLRHRPGRPGRASREDLRAVLHHQAGPPRHRPGPGALPRRPPPDRRRNHPGPVRARRRVPTGLSDQVPVGELNPCRTRAPLSWWWTTIRWSSRACANTCASRATASAPRSRCRKACRSSRRTTSTWR